MTTVNTSATAKLASRLSADQIKAELVKMGTTGNQYKVMFDDLLKECLIQVNVHGNIMPLRAFYETVLSSSPRDIKVAQKAVQTLSKVKLGESTSQGRYEFKELAGVIAEKDLTEADKRRIQNLESMINDKIVKMADGKEEDGKTTKWVDAAVATVWDLADWSKPKGAKVAPDMGSLQKQLFGKMKANKDLKTFDFVEPFLRNVLTQTGIDASQRLTREEADKIIALINEKVK